MPNIIDTESGTISITTPLEPVIYNGNPIPSGRVLQAWLKGAPPHELAELALEASIYRFEDRPVLLVTRNIRNDDRVLRQVRDTFIVFRKHEQVAIRPCFTPEQGLLARFEHMDPTPQLTMLLMAEAAKLGYEPASWRGRRADFVPTGTADLFLMEMGIDHTSDAHMLVRAKVITGRPGGLTVPLRLDSKHMEEYYTSDVNDGTMVITDQLTRPFQGTLVGGMRNSFSKGVARPPLVYQDFTECNAACMDASFGNPLETRGVAQLHVLSHLPSSRASLNIQAVLFNAADPAQVIRDDAELLERLTPSDFLSPEEQAKVDAGVPIAFFIDDYAPWKWATQLFCDGVRATVFGTHLLHRGEVGFMPATWSRLRKLGFQEGDAITLLRDPALPNATGMPTYTIAPDQPLRWASNYYGHGIVLNYQDPGWKRAGGDFDGDAAVAFRRQFALQPPLDVEYDLRASHKQPLLGGSITSTIAGTLIDGLAPSLGPTIAAALRLAERGYLDDSVRVFTSDLAQGCVSAQKHAMLVDEGRAMYTILRTLMDMVEPDEGYLLDKLRNVRNQVGYAAKQTAWNKLVHEQLPEHANSGLPVVDALVSRVLVLHELYRMLGWLRRDNAVLPKHLQQAAVHNLLEAVGPVKAAKQADAMARWRKRWITARRELTKLNEELENNNEEDSEARVRTRVLTDELTHLQVLLKWSIAQGQIDEFAVIAYAPNFIAATVPTAASFKQLECSVTEICTGIRKTCPPLILSDKPQKMHVGMLVPHLFSTDTARDKPLLDMPRDQEVIVQLLRNCDKSQQIKVMF